MDETSYKGQQFRLRAGTPMPIGGEVGVFVYHTFMAEKSAIEVITCTEDLPASSEFRGQGGREGLISASYSRLNTKGGNLFSGRKLYSPEFVDEDDI